MSLFLPLLLAGALAAPITSPNVSLDDKNPRARSVVIDTTAHRKLAADYVVKARLAAEGGSLQEARAQLLVANTMMRESGGLEAAAVYALVHIDYALDNFVEAADLLNQLSDEALEKGNASVSANAALTAAELYSLAGRRTQVSNAVARVRSLLNDSRISETDRRALRKRVG
ncbi:MAG: hypothetical protein ABI120_23940 [Gemmatimonadaceae bacterium]